MSDDIEPDEPTDADREAAAASQSRVREALVATTFADVVWVAQTGSTNVDVIERARQGDAEGIVVVADHQRAGRGRRGRTWEAPAGASLMFTALLRPPAAVAGLATMAMAVAAAGAVEELTGVQPGLKWPNDLVWPGDGSSPDRKLAGILAEADWPTGSNVASGWAEPKPTDRVTVAVGIGINVAWAGITPGDLADRAVALDEITAPAVAPDRADLLVVLLRRLDHWYTTLRGPDGAAALLAEWRTRSATLGRQVRVDLGADELVGRAVDVTDAGHLVVETIDGDRRTVAVGDVVHLRPIT